VIFLTRMKILVTGGRGSSAATSRRRWSRRATACACSTTSRGGRRQNLRDVRGDVEFLRGNCADIETARRAVRGIEVVYHEAAVPSVARSVDDPVLSHRANAPRP